MAKQPEVRAIMLNSKKNIKKIKNLTGDAESALALSAMQVLVFSLMFILMVVGLHIVIKFLPNTSPIQLFIAVLAICSSIAFSAYFNQK